MISSESTRVSSSPATGVTLLMLFVGLCLLLLGDG